MHQGENTTVSRAPGHILRPLEWPHAECSFISSVHLRIETYCMCPLQWLFMILSWKLIFFESRCTPSGNILEKRTAVVLCMQCPLTSQPYRSSAYFNHFSVGLILTHSKGSKLAMKQRFMKLWKINKSLFQISGLEIVLHLANHMISDNKVLLNHAWSVSKFTGSLPDVVELMNSWTCL